jgi:hypothetical protein
VQSLQAIEAQRRTIDGQLAGERRHLVDQLETQIRTLRALAISTLTAVVEETLADVGNDWEERVKSATGQSLEQFFGDARERVVALFSKQATEGLSHHQRGIDAIVDQVRREAAETFDIDFASEDESEPFRLRQEPYWVTEELTATLIPDLSRLGDRLLPNALRWHRRREWVLAQTKELIVRNAESLRWAILRSLDDIFRTAPLQFEQRLNAAIEATKGVIDDAASRRRDESFAAQAEIDRLDRAIAELKERRSALMALH